MKRFYFSKKDDVTEARLCETEQEAIERADYLVEKFSKEYWVWELRKVVRLATPSVVVEEPD